MSTRHLLAALGGAYLEACDRASRLVQAVRRG